MSPSQYIRYWGSNLRAEYNLYKEGLARHERNVNEYNIIRRRLSQGFRNHPAIAAIYSGLPVRRHGDSFTLPQLTRRESQLLLRNRWESWIARIPFQHRSIPRRLLPMPLQLFAHVLMRLARMIVVQPWVAIVIARTPLSSRLLPSILQPHVDRTRPLRALCRKSAYFSRDCNYSIENIAANSALTEAQQREEVAILNPSRWVQWQYVTHGALSCEIIPWLPYPMPQWLEGEFTAYSADRCCAVVADTLLVMREGGFKTLSAEDVYEYSVSCASPTFIENTQQRSNTGANPGHEAMRRAMVPVLEKRAKRTLAIDGTKMPPDSVWMLEPRSRLHDRRPEDSVWGRPGLVY